MNTEQVDGGLSSCGRVGVEVKKKEVSSNKNRNGEDDKEIYQTEISNNPNDLGKK